MCPGTCNTSVSHRPNCYSRSLQRSSGCCRPRSPSNSYSTGPRCWDRLVLHRHCCGTRRHASRSARCPERCPHIRYRCRHRGCPRNRGHSGSWWSRDCPSRRNPGRVPQRSQRPRREGAGSVRRSPDGRWHRRPRGPRCSHSQGRAPRRNPRNRRSRRRDPRPPIGRSRSG